MEGLGVQWQPCFLANMATKRRCLPTKKRKECRVPPPPRTTKKEETRRTACTTQRTPRHLSKFAFSSSHVPPRHGPPKRRFASALPLRFARLRPSARGRGCRPCPRAWPGRRPSSAQLNDHPRKSKKKIGDLRLGKENAFLGASLTMPSLEDLV